MTHCGRTAPPGGALARPRSRAARPARPSAGLPGRSRRPWRWRRRRRRQQRPGRWSHEAPEQDGGASAARWRSGLSQRLSAAGSPAACPGSGEQRRPFRERPGRGRCRAEGAGIPARVHPRPGRVPHGAGPPGLRGGRTGSRRPARQGSWSLGGSERLSGRPGSRSWRERRSAPKLSPRAEPSRPACRTLTRRDPERWPSGGRVAEAAGLELGPRGSGRSGRERCSPRAKPQRQHPHMASRDTLRSWVVGREENKITSSQVGGPPWRSGEW